MEYRRRHTDIPGAYPLACQDELDWERCADHWAVELRLPEIPEKHIVVPSLAMLRDSTPFQCSIEPGDGGPSCLLNPVPARNAAARPSDEARMTETYEAQIDCWHTRRDSQPRVRLSVYGDQRPQRYLLTLTVRPLTLPAETALDTAPAQLGTKAPTLTPISQMQAERSIAPRVCSPTALTIALSGAAPAPPWPLALRACFDPITRAYGSWPLAVRWGALNGRLGAVEVLTDLAQAAELLKGGYPIVCSIDYASNALSGAPLKQTSGHLVVLTGADVDTCHVLDPAAPTHDAVAQRYPRAEFMDAWLRRRGAAYIFGSPCD